MPRLAGQKTGAEGHLWGQPKPECGAFHRCTGSAGRGPHWTRSEVKRRDSSSTNQRNEEGSNREQWERVRAAEEEVRTEAQGTAKEPMYERSGQATDLGIDVHLPCAQQQADHFQVPDFGRMMETSGAILFLRDDRSQ